MAYASNITALPLWTETSHDKMAEPLGLVRRSLKFEGMTATTNLENNNLEGQQATVPEQVIHYQKPI